MIAFVATLRLAGRVWLLTVILLVFSLTGSSNAGFLSTVTSNTHATTTTIGSSTVRRVALLSKDVTIRRMVSIDTKKEKEEITTDNAKEDAKKELLSPEETTEKYGLEVGLLQSIKSSDAAATASSLLKKYGVAYLATSIPLAIVSFALCYVLVDVGIDVESLLHKVPGLENVDLSNGGAQAGTVAIAYAAHKAASPLRFPPTVLLTPVVAKFLGKVPPTEEQDETGENNAN
jgi:hypothetical protein